MPPQVKRKARLLVVDDDPGLLRLLTIRLRAENYEVDAVESAAAALAALARVRPDLVITDLRMDQMDGIGLLKEIQSRAPGLRVIIGLLKTMRERDGRLVLRRPSPTVSKLLEITDLTSTLDIEP